MQWACTEFQLGETMILKKQAVLDLDDDGKTVVILSRLVFWEIEIRADPRHWEILLAKMKLDGANEIGQCEHKVSGDTSSESARVDSTDVRKI